LDYNEVIIISQGFDAEDFAPMNAEKQTNPVKMKITHSGTFYAERNPVIMLHALANVFRTNPKIRGRIEVHFAGNAREEDRQLVKRLNLQNAVYFLGYLPHRECIQCLVESDVLWFVLDNDYQTPGKLYEYFGSRKPIIASLVDGYTKQVIEECGAAICVPLKDEKAHELAILDQFKRFEQKKLERIQESFSAKFNRLTLTAELAKQFELLLDYDRAGIVKVKERSV
jgi:glycosyltransferase involved in cell wall biosynthesis